jgi:hypothetical protein
MAFGGCARVGGDTSLSSDVAHPPPTAPETTAPPAALAFEDRPTAPSTSVEPDREEPATDMSAIVAAEPTAAAPGTTQPRAPRPPAAPVDPTVGYRGVLGTLGPGDVVAAATISAPRAQPNAAPLTGLWFAEVPRREAVVVKIDNSPKARPQVGLNTADIVIEERVEGGITRLAAIFHSRSTVVGPVRSGRTTDISFLTALGSPSLVYSGANASFDALLLAQPTVANFSAARTGGYWRDSGRKAPSNLFTDTATFSRAGNPPPPQFAYRPFGEAAPWPGASHVRIDFGRTVSEWSWDVNAGAWVRSQDAKAHNTDGGRVATTNVIVAVVDEVDTGAVDTAGSPVPEFVFVGSGPVTVFSGAHVIQGTWTRPSLRSPALLTDASGQPIELDPGRTWIELVTTGQASWS